MKRGESQVTGQPATELGRAKAAGEDGQEERENLMSKGEQAEHLHE